MQVISLVGNIGSTVLNIASIQDGTNFYVRSKTTSTLPPGSPNINFQQLVLRGRMWSSPAELIAVFTTESSNGDCYNCTETSQYHMVAPLNQTSGIQWIAISKHKLKDTRATNAFGNPPSKFFIKEHTNNEGTKAEWKGEVVYGCSASPVFPAGPPPDWNED